MTFFSAHYALFGKLVVLEPPERNIGRGILQVFSLIFLI